MGFANPASLANAGSTISNAVMAAQSAGSAARRCA
jgi:hypothetical protein